MACDDSDTPPASPHGGHGLDNLARQEIRSALLRSGLWPALRARPYGRVADPGVSPSALFVTAIDTNPLSTDPAVVIGKYAHDFENGLRALRRLADARLIVCADPKVAPVLPTIEEIESVVFDGPHPAGLPGTHIHRLARLRAGSEIWHIGYQDVIAVGKLLGVGEQWGRRVIAIGGPGCSSPRLVEAPLGASLEALLEDDFHPGNIVISGSVLSGRRVGPADRFLGRYDLQVTVLPADDPAAAEARRGWSTGMIPVEDFERVWPLEVPAAALLRALMAEDTESAEAMGCLALAPEDLALCAFVCPSRCDYGAALETTLAAIQRLG